MVSLPASQQPLHSLPAAPAAQVDCALQNGALLPTQHHGSAAAVLLSAEPSSESVAQPAGEASGVSIGWPSLASMTGRSTGNSDHVAVDPAKQARELREDPTPQQEALRRADAAATAAHMRQQQQQQQPQEQRPQWKPNQQQRYQPPPPPPPPQRLTSTVPTHQHTPQQGAQAWSNVPQTIYGVDMAEVHKKILGLDQRAAAGVVRQYVRASGEWVSRGRLGLSGWVHFVSEPTVDMRLDLSTGWYYSMKTDSLLVPENLLRNQDQPPRGRQEQKDPFLSSVSLQCLQAKNLELLAEVKENQRVMATQQKLLRLVGLTGPWRYLENDNQSPSLLSWALLRHSIKESGAPDNGWRFDYNTGSFYHDEGGLRFNVFTCQMACYRDVYSLHKEECLAANFSDFYINFADSPQQQLNGALRYFYHKQAQQDAAITGQLAAAALAGFQLGSTTAGRAPGRNQGMAASSSAAAGSDLVSGSPTRHMQYGHIQAGADYVESLLKRSM